MTMKYGDNCTTVIIALEIVYFLAFRMAKIHQSLASYARALIQAADMKNNLYVVLYALEIIYRRMKTHGNLAWNVREGNVLHPLVSLYQAFSNLHN